MSSSRIVTLHSELVVIDEIDLESSRRSNQLILGKSRVYRASSPRWELFMRMVMNRKLTLLVRAPILSALWMVEDGNDTIRLVDRSEGTIYQSDEC